MEIKTSTLFVAAFGQIVKSVALKPATDFNDVEAMRKAEAERGGGKRRGPVAYRQRSTIGLK